MTDSHDEGPVMYVARMDAIVNRYRGQYFVTLREGVWELGLDPDDPDWAHIGWDWVRPADADAWRRLKKKRELAA